MNIIEKPVSDLIPYENNPRLNDAAVDPVASSIREFGFKVPIVIDRNGVIVAGHGRYEAAKLLGLETVPCKYADELTEDQIRAYRMIDNRVVSAEYDLELEFEELQDIKLDMGEFDFETFNMDEIEEVSGYDENNDDREYFTAAFTFPTAQKEQILRYLCKHKAEITAEIIEKAGEVSGKLS